MFSTNLTRNWSCFIIINKDTIYTLYFLWHIICDQRTLTETLRLGVTTPSTTVAITFHIFFKSPFRSCYFSSFSCSLILMLRSLGTSTSITTVLFLCLSTTSLVCWSLSRCPPGTHRKVRGVMHFDPGTSAHAWHRCFCTLCQARVHGMYDLLAFDTLLLGDESPQMHICTAYIWVRVC